MLLFILIGETDNGIVMKTSNPDDPGYAAGPGGSSSQQSDQQPGQKPRQARKRTNPIFYIIIVILAVALAGIAYYVLVGSSGSVAPFNFSNTTGLNATQKMYIDDLKSAQQSGGIEVTYARGPAISQRITESANLTVEENVSQEITSYALGSDSRSIYAVNATFTNVANGKVLNWSASTVYYYNTTSATVTCQSNTTTSMPVNSSPYCFTGAGGASFLQSFPFTLKNLSYMGYLSEDNGVLLGNVSVSYGGTKTYAGNRCDSFVISNATADLLSNYSVYDICIDGALGLPLYFNQTDIVDGAVNDTYYLQAVSVSTNVSSSDFVIPSAYISGA
jgi:hypothetical protein